MSKQVQRGRKVKAVPIALEPAPIMLQPAFGSEAVQRDNEEEEDDHDNGTEEAKNGASNDTTMPQTDVINSYAGGGSEMAMLTHQLQLMQQMMMMQQQQHKAELQQHKAELEETKKVFMNNTAVAAPVDVTPLPASFTSFRTSVPALPLQNDDTEEEAATDTATNMLRGRIGMVNDSIVAPSSRQDYSHLTEFQLGSRYVIKGLGLM